TPGAGMKRLRQLAIAAMVVTIAQITLGATVRATGSGDACPDWPRCFGRWIPPFRSDTLIEYSHRLMGTLVGTLILILAVMAWLKFRTSRRIFFPSLIALMAVMAEGWIGREVVVGNLPANLIVVHLLTSLAILGVLTFLVASTSRRPPTPAAGLGGPVLAGALGTLAVLVVGAFVAQFGAALAFPDWPLMNGGLAPGEGLQSLHWTHRIAAGLLGVLLGYMAFRATRAQPKDRKTLILAHSAFALWLAQSVIGGLNVLTRLAGWAVVLHVLFGALLWAAVVSLSTFCLRRAPAPETSGVQQTRGPGVLDKVGAYVALTKPRIIELLLITTVPAMVLAERGWPSLWLVLATLIGGTLTAGSANSINCYFDRDIDSKMDRTSSRPLPRHRVEPRPALIFGIVLGFIGFGWLVLTVNLSAALLAVSAILFYVFVYTILMKRTTPSNIVIGGAAGAVPVLVGWAAVTGTVELPAWVMFAIVFYWTPPHFWALSLRYKEDYAAAGVPMLPVVKGVEETTRQIVLYCGVLFGVSLLLFPLAKLGLLYLTAAVLLACGFTASALRLYAAPDNRRAMQLFHFSITYLVLLFVAVAVDRLLGGQAPEVVYRLTLIPALAGAVLFQSAIIVRDLIHRPGSAPLERAAPEAG
ncbi:MAG: heme o synthase, partial [Actinomycetota bacterium]